MKDILSTKVFFISLVLVSMLLFVFGLFLVLPKQKKRDAQVSLQELYLQCVDSTKNPKEKGTCLRSLAARTIQHYTISEMDHSFRMMPASNKLQWCHEFTHYVGWELFKKTGNMYDAFITASSTCNSGMYHGIIEQYINTQKQNSTADNFVHAVIPTACQNKFIQGLPQAERFNCYHGLGHAFMFITGNALNASLRYCDSTQNPEGCYSGAFMENLQSKQIGNAAVHSQLYSFDSKDPDSPCTLLSVQYKTLCYSYKAAFFVNKTGGDYTQSFHDCLTVTASYRSACYMGVSNDIPGPHLTSFASGKACLGALSIGPEVYTICIANAMQSVLILTEGNAKEVVTFCAAIEPGYKADCYRAAGHAFIGWATKKESQGQKCAYFTDAVAHSLCFLSDKSKENAVVRK